MAPNIYTQPGSDPAHITLLNKSYDDCVADMNPCQMNIATDRLHPVFADHLGNEHSVLATDDTPWAEAIPFGIAGAYRLEFDGDFTYSEINKRLTVENIQITSKLMHIGDDDTSLEFGTNTISLNAGGFVGAFVDGSTGFVGFGTDEPDRQIEVYGTTSFFDSLLVLAKLTAICSEGPSEGFGAALEYAASPYGSGGEIVLGMDSAYWNATGKSTRAWSTYNAGVDNLAERMWLNELGYLGIGVSDPDAIIESFGAAAQLKLSFDATDYWQFFVDTDKDITISGGLSAILKLGDAAAAEKLYIKDSGDATVGSWDSDGTLTAKKITINPGTDAVIEVDGNYGIKMATQEADFYIDNSTSAYLGALSPLLGIWNYTQEDSDGGRESDFFFRGYRSDGNDGFLAALKASHVGTSTDYKGKLQFFIADASHGGIGTIPLCMTLNYDGGVFIHAMKSGANQGAAGAAAGELWSDSSTHAVYIGV